jgi:hypothetical protein
MNNKMSSKLKLLTHNYLHTFYSNYNFSTIRRLISKTFFIAFLLMFFPVYSCKTCKCPAYSQIESQIHEYSKYCKENHS